MAGWRGGSDAAVPMQCPLHPHHPPQQVLACDFCCLGPGEPLCSPFRLLHGTCVSCIVGATFTGQKMVLGCPTMGWVPRSAGGGEGDVVSQAMEGAWLWVCDGSVLAGHEVQDLLPHPPEPVPFCCTSPRCLGPVFSCLHPKLPAVHHTHLFLRALSPCHPCPLS